MVAPPRGRPVRDLSAAKRETSTYLASSPEVAGQSGLYFVRRKPAAASPQAEDDATAKRLWRLSEELTGLALS